MRPWRAGVPYEYHARLQSTVRYGRTHKRTIRSISDFNSDYIHHIMISPTTTRVADHQEMGHGKAAYVHIISLTLL